jgi:tRNA A-37 threonylcarbamoyl transferase component Bud32
MSLCGECQREAPQGAIFCAFCGAPLGSGAAAEVQGALAGATVARRYFLESVLGRGGMGDVYRATDLAHERAVVVKLLRRTAATDETAVKRFHREARAASHLSHPSSVALLDSGETEAGMLYMVMELVPGVTLARLLSERGALSERRAVGIGAQILAALAEAHGLGIIHRDLKPANVMIDVQEGEDRVKVLDFGIALFGDAGPDARVTQQGQVFGTPAYMSPEQIRGERLDARSDLYSLGVVLYELLTGKLPFDAATSMELAARHLTDVPPAMAERRPGSTISPELEALVLSAMAKDRAERPPSAEAFHSALLACPLVPAASEPAAPALAPTVPLDGREAVEVARRSTGWLSARRRRWRWTALAAAAALGVAGAAAAAFALRGAVARPPPSPAPAPAAEAASAPSTTTPPPAMPAAGTATPPAPDDRASTIPSRGADAGMLDPALRPAASASRTRAAPAPADAVRHVPAAAPRERSPGPVGEPGIRAIRGELNSLPLPPASSGDGLLALEASPWAEVSVDGQALGETPREVQLGAGVHLVRAVHRELGVREARVTVRAGQRTVWVAEMER